MDEAFLSPKAILHALMFRLTKRQRLKHPSCWMDVESIESLPYPLMDAPSNVLRTHVAALLTKDIFMDRFRKEILQPFRFTLSSQLQVMDGESLEDVKERRTLLRQRILVGINAVTRALELAVAATKPTTTGSSDIAVKAALVNAPLLIVLSTDVPPTVTMQIPILAKQLGVPVLLLPGMQTSHELGELFGIRTVAAMAIVPNIHNIETMCKSTTMKTADHVNNAVDSFAAFMIGKVETQS
jgi:ribosomal protein L7Ae-like RNA K-turn-binding protein